MKRSGEVAPSTNPDYGRYETHEELMAARAARQLVRAAWRVSNPEAPRWFLIYRERIDLGLETCRRCGRKEGPLLRKLRYGYQHVGRLRLSFDHIWPVYWGGSAEMSNAQILCERCNVKKGCKRPSPLPPSLWDEEQAAPPEKRWSELPFVRGPRGGFEL